MKQGYLKVGDILNYFLSERPVNNLLVIQVLRILTKFVPFTIKGRELVDSIDLSYFFNPDIFQQLSSPLSEFLSAWPNLLKENTLENLLDVPENIALLSERNEALYRNLTKNKKIEGVLSVPARETLEFSSLILDFTNISQSYLFIRNKTLNEVSFRLQVPSGFTAVPSFGKLASSGIIKIAVRFLGLPQHLLKSGEKIEGFLFSRDLNGFLFGKVKLLAFNLPLLSVSAKKLFFKYASIPTQLIFYIKNNASAKVPYIIKVLNPKHACVLKVDQESGDLPANSSVAVNLWCNFQYVKESHATLIVSSSLEHHRVEIEIQKMPPGTKIYLFQ